MYEFLKVKENKDHDQSKVSIVTEAYIFNLLKVRKMVEVIWSELVKVTSNLLQYDINPDALFHDWESHHKSLKNYFKP